MIVPDGWNAKPVGGELRQIRASINAEGNREVRACSNQLHDPMLPRKSSFRELNISPYRNPTQVDEERILRRSK